MFHRTLLLSQASLRRPFATKVPTTRGRNYLRRTGYIILGLGSIYGADRIFNASSITRNLRTLTTCLMITLDYKINFTEEKSDLIPELHARVADRMHNLFTSNGGLYIKIGQAIGANASLLPKAMQEKFAKLFDDAPQVLYSEILSVFQSEFGRPPSGPGGVFAIFEEQAVASASIAQVHKAKLWPSPDDAEGEWVAVKVQKPAIAKQVEFDLSVYRAVMWMFENWVFDLPVYFVVDFVTDHLRRELDFILESENAKQTAKFIASEPRLANSVYIPKVYDEFTTKRVMTAEWISGVRLSDRAGIGRLMGEENNIIVSQATVPSSVLSPEEPPPNSFQFPPKPLKGGVRSVMQTMVELFSAQMFTFGSIHGDPHPGNILIRPNPQDPTIAQLVLLDHGLYVRVDEEFRRDWSLLWKGLLTGKFKEVERTTKKWGIGLPDMFASVALAKPVRLTRKDRKAEAERVTRELQEYLSLSQYEQSVRMKAKLKQFLNDTHKLPQALIFLLRNMRIVQGNNQSYGAPVNRVKITGLWASKSLARSPNLSISQRLREYANDLVFRSVILSLDIAFWTTRIKQRIYALLGWKTYSFEDELERAMRGLMKNSTGVEVGNTMFSG
ncbi:ABC1 family-domain-containing protein [Rhodocollybia butyracea]|uniref:ABC1 family-domain-containing protein n=1 Tax=Rhodocollybia butyracea TaxID=206335 RepID=A0A9P5Q1H7_9AGAR|nr:ABC1 family-domain-containing protein [Rhodocollybia butyracea]